ncbi:MAG: hypothetical protein ABI679_02805 [Gemmatimonadota bacterium]
MTDTRRSALAKRSSLTKSSISEARNQRQELPVQPGATGKEEALSPAQALHRALHHLGKTGKHTSDDHATRTGTEQ